MHKHENFRFILWILFFGLLFSEVSKAQTPVLTTAKSYGTFDGGGRFLPITHDLKYLYINSGYRFAWQSNLHWYNPPIPFDPDAPTHGVPVINVASSLGSRKMPSTFPMNLGGTDGWVLMGGWLESAEVVDGPWMFKPGTTIHPSCRTSTSKLTISDATATGIASSTSYSSSLTKTITTSNKFTVTIGGTLGVKDVKLLLGTTSYEWMRSVAMADQQIYTSQWTDTSVYTSTIAYESPIPPGSLGGEGIQSPVVKAYGLFVVGNIFQDDSSNNTSWIEENAFKLWRKQLWLGQILIPSQNLRDKNGQMHYTTQGLKTTSMSDAEYVKYCRQDILAGFMVASKKPAMCKRTVPPVPPAWACK